MPNIKLITENLADELIPGIKKASSIYIMTSFVMESGVRLLAPHLIEAIARGAEVRILAGDYLYITQPKALKMLINLSADLEARLWRSSGTSFHPKAYLLDYDHGEGLFIVGSSNTSSSAYRMGIEWNLAVNAEVEPYTFQEAVEKYLVNFYHENTVALNAETLRIYEQIYEKNHQQNPELTRTITEMEEAELMLPDKQRQEIHTSINTSEHITPRLAQKDALEALDITYEEGYDRAMVVMATGLGKTYLAGFFAQRFKRVLFIAHREEILEQAKRSFEHIMPSKTTGFYYGREKRSDADFIFASIFTLARKKHRKQFAPQHFDLIVVDEFHHAAARSYELILHYFQPQFLLGLTATPDRMDGKDVYALCHGNIAYQVHFLEAIGRGWLSPFHYYGVYDDTDYSLIRWVGNFYDEEQLRAVQLREEMAERIFEAWDKHKQTRTIAFCSSIVQADFLAEHFKQRGANVISLHSRTRNMTRSEAIDKLSAGHLDVIFTVDLFNEGVDIPPVDTLLFVRPTESLTVFTQQIGRGLRLHDGKQFCTIIDLIGNYRNADLKLSLFNMERDERTNGSIAKTTPVLPAMCEMHLELEVVNLLDEMVRKKQPRNERLREAYTEVKKELGRRPTYVELHLHGIEDSRGYSRGSFESFYDFLNWAGELTEEEQAVFAEHARWLREVEKTSMSKSYKMVLLLAMLERGPNVWFSPVHAREVAPFFHSYLSAKPYRIKADLSDKQGQALMKYDEAKLASLIARMPMTMWSGSSKGLITFQDDIFEVQLDVENLESRHKEILYEWTKDICLYRLQWYFERRG